MAVTSLEVSEDLQMYIVGARINKKELKSTRNEKVSKGFSFILAKQVHYFLADRVSKFCVKH